MPVTATSRAAGSGGSEPPTATAAAIARASRPSPKTRCTTAVVTRDGSATGSWPAASTVPSIVVRSPERIIASSSSMRKNGVRPDRSASSSTSRAVGSSPVRRRTSSVTSSSERALSATASSRPVRRSAARPVPTAGPRAGAGRLVAMTCTRWPRPCSMRCSTHAAVPSSASCRSSTVSSTGDRNAHPSTTARRRSWTRRAEGGPARPVRVSPSSVAAATQGRVVLVAEQGFERQAEGGVGHPGVDAVGVDRDRPEPGALRIAAQLERAPTSCRCRARP